MSEYFDYDAQDARDTREAIHQLRAAADAISGAFIWDRHPLGHDYWSAWDRGMAGLADRLEEEVNASDNAQVA